MGIQGSYYFRAVPESWNEDIIKEIADLGHEVGYHYETMDSAKGNVDLAYKQFVENLEKLRKLVPVTTICMHGSPRSKFDNKDIWKKYDYKSLGLIGEPYYDMDFDKFFYLTDTGRKWDGWKTSVRDKVPQQVEWVKRGLVFRSWDIIRDLIVYQKAYKLAMEIFEITKAFPKEERYSLTDQIRRSSRSVTANITEAWAKKIYIKSFVSKINDSLGEEYETEGWLDYSKDCHYIDIKTHSRIMSGYDEVRKMLISMMNSPEKFCKK